MAKRRNARTAGLLTRWVLCIGVATTVCGLLLPWLEIDPAAYGWFESVLADIGLIPDAGRPVRGYEIPWRVREESSRAGVAAALVIDDIGRGRLDRAAARALFGERLEVDLAPTVFIPAALAALHGALLALTSRQKLLWAWIALLDLLMTLGFAVLVLRVSDDDLGAPLRIHSGIWCTLAGVCLMAIGALRASRR